MGYRALHVLTWNFGGSAVKALISVPSPSAADLASCLPAHSAAGPHPQASEHFHPTWLLLATGQGGCFWPSALILHGFQLSAGRDETVRVAVNKARELFDCHVEMTYKKTKSSEVPGAVSHACLIKVSVDISQVWSWSITTGKWSPSLLAPWDNLCMSEDFSKASVGVHGTLSTWRRLFEMSYSSHP